MTTGLEYIPGWGEYLVHYDGIGERPRYMSAVDLRYASDALDSAREVFGDEGVRALAAIAPDVFHRAMGEILGD